MTARFARWLITWPACVKREQIQGHRFFSENSISIDRSIEPKPVKLIAARRAFPLKARLFFLVGAKRDLVVRAQMWLHTLLMKFLRRTVAAWWALTGMAVTPFAFLGVNMFLSGLHSYGAL